MDEHLFTVLAKLKADELKLRQEHLQVNRVAQRESVRERRDAAVIESRIVRELRWREQS